MGELIDLAGIRAVLTLTEEIKMSFIAHFSTIEDPRSHINVKHDFLDILFLTVSAVISGAEGWKDIKEFW